MTFSIVVVPFFFFFFLSVLKRFLQEALNTSLCILPVQREVEIICQTPRETLGLCVVEDSGNLTAF